MTYHGLLRAEERANLPASGALKLINRAEEKGKTAEDFPAAERRYLQNLEQSRDRIVRVFSDYLFIFSSEGIFITMFHIPVWFGKKNKYCGKIAVRNPRKFERFHAMAC